MPEEVHGSEEVTKALFELEFITAIVDTTSRIINEIRIVTKQKHLKQHELTSFEDSLFINEYSKNRHRETQLLKSGCPVSYE